MNDYGNGSYRTKNFVYKLKHPFNYQGHDVSEISIRRPTVGDQIASAKESRGATEEENTFNFYKRICCELSPDCFDLISMSDFVDLAEESKDFLGLSGTKKRSSDEPFDSSAAS